MLRIIANRKLHSALKNRGAPMQLINTRAYYFQDIIEDIKRSRLSPDEGAKCVLDTVYHAFDRFSALNSRRLQ